MMEEWKEIPGYEGLYEVSNMGNVRNVRRNTLLRLTKTNNGYIRVGLSKNGIQTGFKVHRLVAQACLPNPDNLPQVNHKDEDKTNNNVDNLEWCDQAYNNLYGTRLERLINTKIKNGYVNEGNVGFSRKEYMKKYYQKNKDSYKKNYQENKDSYKEKNKKWRENNKDYHKKWLENHPGYMDKYKKNKI